MSGKLFQRSCGKGKPRIGARELVISISALLRDFRFFEQLRYKDGVKPRHAAALALVGRYLMVLGAVCLVVVVLTHVFERWRLFPWMGWGLRHSAGHYLDLCAAVLGLTSLPAGYSLWLRAKWELRFNISNWP